MDNFKNIYFILLWNILKILLEFVGALTYDWLLQQDVNYKILFILVTKHCNYLRITDSISFKLINSYLKISFKQFTTDRHFQWIKWIF